MSDSHSDVDDELLALAGGGDMSSDEEGSRPPSRQRSRSNSARSADHSPLRDSTTKKNQNKKRRGSAESEDEGEASEPGSPNSEGSAAMDESDSDDDFDAGQGKALQDDENKYPVDGLFVSYTEKSEIMSMREVEREQILADREAEKERLRQKALLRRLVTNSEQDKQKKRKASEADLQDGSRKASRTRTKPSALDTLKRARAEKSDRMRRRETERRRDRSPSYRSVSSHSRHSDESDVEWAASSKKKRSKTPPEEAPLAELRDVEKCRLSRTRFAMVVFYPGFDEALRGCYIRIHIGPDPNTKQPVYRMAVIKGFTTGRPYAIENERGKSLVVDKYVLAAHGKAEREWPFIACSESPFTDGEWNRYQITCKNDGITIPRKPELYKKMDDINGLIGRKWTDLEISEKVKKQQALMDRFSGVERQRVERDLAQARAHGNDELAEELQDKLDKMPAPRLAFQTTLKKSSPAKPATPSQQDRLAEKNALNRQLNAKQVREAQLAERRRVREVEERAGGGEDAWNDADPLSSSQQRGRARTRLARGDSTLSNNSSSGFHTPAGNGTPAPGGGPPPKTTAKKDDLLPHMAKLKEAQLAEASAKGGVPMIHKTLYDDDIIGALDLELDVEID